MSYEFMRMEADPRRFPRYYVNRRARLTGPSGEIDAWVVDVGGSGARIDLDVMASPTFDGPGWHLDLPGVGSWPVVRIWSRGSSIGVLFDLGADQQARLAQELGRRYAKTV
jgi:hypothetical protein